MLGLFEHINASPIHWKLWMNLMGLVNFGAIIFALKDTRARAVVLAMIGNLIFMSLLYTQFGYTRILGLSHIIFWSPLLVYLWKKRDAFPNHIWATRWMWGVMIINGLSLLIDYTDVIRYILGEKSPL